MYIYIYIGAGRREEAALADLGVAESRGQGRPSFRSYYTILYYTILYYTMLCYTILYYTILHYNILGHHGPRGPRSLRGNQIMINDL